MHRNRSSWFSKASASKSRWLSTPDSPHELPRWRSPSPMAASIIPPPIVQSTYPTSPEVTPQVVVDQPSPLQDRQSELEADLQFLLDAQADGLIRGLEGGLPADQASTGSTTPTAQSVRSSSARKNARPMRKKIGLRSARKGIYTTILALSSVKEYEIHDIDEQLNEKDQVLAQIDQWEQKKQGLRDVSHTMEDNEDTIRGKRLRQEADNLQEKINTVELQLAGLKSQHRKILRQAAAAENTVQARLASYTSSLRLLEEDVQKFLSLKPKGSIERPPSQDGSKASMWQLPPKRRTLEMAKEQFGEERDAILQQRQGVEFEKAALDEGATIWKSIVETLSSFEKSLREEMSAIAPSRDDTSNDAARERLRHILRELDSVVESLEQKIRTAEEKNWTLLIAAIGAELDALKQGKKILEGVLGPLNGTAIEPDELDGGLIDTATNEPSRDDDIIDEMNGLDKSSMTARRTRTTSSGSDDDPDPDLMFSRSNMDDR